jgi:HSP20 family molecular chaperone IbpA
VFLDVNMVGQLMDNPFFSASRGIGSGGVRRGWDAKETDDSLHLRLDMPGFGKEDVKICVEHNISLSLILLLVVLLNIIFQTWLLK